MNLENETTPLYFRAKSVEDLEDIAKDIKDFIEEQKCNLLLFYGGMGAGKTTLIRALCTSMGVVESVTSPTFAIVNEYEDAKEQPIYHFDLYRLEDLRELYDIGYEDYFFSDNLCMIEWPERISTVLDSLTSELKIVTIEIETTPENYREIIVKGL